MAVQLRYESAGVRVVDTNDNTGTYFDKGFFPFAGTTRAAAEQAALYHITANLGVAPTAITPQLGATVPLHINTSGGSGNTGSSTISTSGSSSGTSGKK